jgi:hypothetical protein
MLLADLFDLYAAALDRAEGATISSAASSALTYVCRDAAANVRDLLDALPADVTNWISRGVAPGPRGSRKV